jgi:hypothetical protein
MILNGNSRRSFILGSLIALFLFGLAQRTCAETIDELYQKAKKEAGTLICD